MVVVTGWIAAVCILLAGLLPLGYRARAHKRAAPASPTIRAHVALGTAVSGIAFVHTLFVLPSLGSPAAITGGATAMAPGAAAFFVLVAHTGVGLQLRRERLKDRAKKRSIHLTTAIVIVALVTLHVIALR